MNSVAFAFAVAFVVSMWAASGSSDDTDPPGGRSGMVLLTDHKTGCQYLARVFGGITPRLDGQGRHVGCK